MTFNLNMAQALQPRRIQAYFDSFAGTGPMSVNDWTLLRGGAVRHPIASAWIADSGVVAELALNEPLVPDTLYTLSHAVAGRTVSFVFNAPPQVTQPAAVEEQGDPEAEAFGEDTDWLADALTATRDLPVVRGLDALKHDLAAVAVLNPGELVHRPAAGVGIRSRVNSNSTDTTLREVEADVTAAYLNDDRVREVTVAVEQVPERALTRLRVNVLTPQLAGESIDFTVRV